MCRILILVPVGTRREIGVTRSRHGPFVGERGGLDYMLAPPLYFWGSGNEKPPPKSSG